MKRRDVERILEAKLDELAGEIINRLKKLPGDVWTGYAADLQRGQSLFFAEFERVLDSECDHVARGLSSADLELLWLRTESNWDHEDDERSGRGIWEDGVSADLFRRVTSAAACEELEEEEEEEQEAYEFEEEDLVFFAQVASVLDRPSVLERLPLRDSLCIQETIQCLRRLPQCRPSVQVRVEVSHRVSNDDGFSESCSCVIALSVEQIEFSATGTQFVPGVGSDSVVHESFEWYPGGESYQDGNTQVWLERLIYALESEPSIDVADASDEDGSTCGKSLPGGSKT